GSGERARNERHPFARLDQPYGFERRSHRREDHRRERTEQHREAEKTADQKKKRRTCDVSRLNEKKKRREAQRVPELMLRLIQKKALETVDLHPVIDPVRHRIDVERPQLVERSAALPDRPDPVGALEARTEDDADACHGRGPRAIDEMPDEEIEE